MTEATAARHNLLQARLDQILGQGSGKSGYGQGIPGYGPALSSYQVSNLPESPLSVISAADINGIYADMLRARVHQIGTEPTEIAQLAAELNTIAEETSNKINDLGILETDTVGTKKGIADYEKLMNNIEFDKFLMHPSQATLETVVSSTRSSVWNGIIYHEFTISFINEDHRRHFFNSGGEIRIISSITGAVVDKGKDWEAFLQSAGTIKLNHNSTTSSAGTGGSAIGNYQLTPGYQTIYTKSSQGTIDAIYSGNLYKIYARTPNADSIQFRIEYNDVSTGSIVDVNVDGILENTIQLYRADSNYVSVPRPSATTDIALTTFATPQPIYSLSASSPAVSEGSSVTITLSTVNVPNNELVPYNIQGVTSADISNAPLSGNFLVQNNSATLTINVANDTILSENDSELMTVRLVNGSSSVNVRINDATPNPVYGITASSSSVYEGFTATFNVNVQNLPANTLIPYTISGITSADINGNPLVGNFQLDSNGRDTLTLPITLDNFEESETMTVSLDGTTTSASVQILDATYTLLSSNSSPSEGDTITITLVTNKVPNGTVIPYTISGVSTSDIDIPLTGSFTVQNDRASISVAFKADTVSDPNEQFTLALNNGKASITLTVGDTILPTSANRTCIAVIDEASKPTAAKLSSDWTKFRSNWPDRPFYLLQPSPSFSRASLKEPTAFVNDSKTTYSPVNRDGGISSLASDWYTICNLDQLPDGSQIALFIDTSGSMSLATVRASYNLLKQKLNIRNMSIIEVFDGNENWIIPFDISLAGVASSQTFKITISTDEKQINIEDIALSQGWNGSTPVEVNINSGVYIWSDFSNKPALTTGGPFPNGLTINNNGFILGRGGAGGTLNSTGATAGGDAIVISSTNVTINNNGYIAGGGGGGGRSAYSGGGGGAGGGKGGDGIGWGQTFEPGWYTDGNTTGISTLNTTIYRGGTLVINNVGQNGQGYTVTQAGKGGGAGGGGGAGADFGSTKGYGGGGGAGGLTLPGIGGASGDPRRTDFGGTGPGTGEGGSASNPGSPGASAYGGEDVGAGGGGWGAAGGDGTGAPGAAGGAAINSSISYVINNSGTIYGTT